MALHEIYTAQDLKDFRDLVNAAKTDGIDLSIVSGYRSYATQVSTYNYWVAYNGGNVDAADKISTSNFETAKSVEEGADNGPSIIHANGAGVLTSEAAAVNHKQDTISSDSIQKDAAISSKSAAAKRCRASRSSKDERKATFSG